MEQLAQSGEVRSRDAAADGEDEGMEDGGSVWEEGLAEDDGGGGRHLCLLDGGDLRRERVRKVEEKRRRTDEDIDSRFEGEAFLHSETALGECDDGVEVGGEDDEDAWIAADNLEQESVNVPARRGKAYGVAKRQKRLHDVRVLVHRCRSACQLPPSISETPVLTSEIRVST